MGLVRTAPAPSELRGECQTARHCVNPNGNAFCRLNVDAGDDRRLRQRGPWNDLRGPSPWHHGYPGAGTKNGTDLARVHLKRSPAGSSSLPLVSTASLVALGPQAVALGYGCTAPPANAGLDAQLDDGPRFRHLRNSVHRRPV
jgi:hypothetical protein